MKKINIHKMKTANMVAIIYVIFCFIFICLLLFIEVPRENKDLVNFLSGILFSNGIGGIVYFLYNYKKSEYDGYNGYNNSNNCYYCGKPTNDYNKNQMNENEHV